ncbi:MAG: anti-sigma factor RsbW [Acidimicrobiales bacterium]|nr:anti-sigma factor RsbW [Acidimicrobiales bacterium]
MAGEASARGDIVELALPARPDVVSVARLVVGALVAADPLFDEERSADVRLAVSEACTNAIQAQMACATNGSGEPIVLRCTVAEGHLELAVSDHGSGFDPGKLTPHPEVTDPARLDFEGGLGIPLIRLLSDHVEFHVTATGTTVEMTFEPRTEGEDVVLVATTG